MHVNETLLRLNICLKIRNGSNSFFQVHFMRYRNDQTSSQAGPLTKWESKPELDKPMSRPMKGIWRASDIRKDLGEMNGCCIECGNSSNEPFLLSAEIPFLTTALSSTYWDSFPFSFLQLPFFSSGHYPLTLNNAAYKNKATQNKETPLHYHQVVNN